MATALVPIANGTEEIEAVTIIDTLRRADIEVTVASCAEGSKEITCSRGVRLVADEQITDLIERQFDLIALPGGMPGAEHLRDCQPLKAIILPHLTNQRWLAAICASPAVILTYHNWLSGPATCHPAFQRILPETKKRTAEAVVIDHGNKTLTSQGPGTALAFSLAIIEVLLGKSKAEEVAGPMCINVAGRYEQLS
ncbi:DJ-1 family glyoxalase III [Corallincola platygyrae]|uniref:DJ-1 family glyoxalase III n=1 Tax=Corallincola platygyrae TaxID=1193278 RepID=A0ABW4XKJ3_9GAMM